MSFFVYVLFSERIQKKYVGSTKDVAKRLEHHNAGLDRWSKRGVPWVLLYTEEYATRTEALRQEYFFKSGQGRRQLEELLTSRYHPGEPE